MKLSRQLYLLTIAVALLLSQCSFYAAAQSATAGTVQGKITDAQGAAVLNAEVKLTEKSTNTVLSTKSNAEGRYLFVSVEPGNYDVSFSMTGFSEYKVSKQDVLVGQVLTVNAILQVGQMTSVVEVTTSPGAELQTVNATVGTTVSGPSLTYLPIFGSDTSSLALLQPGVTPDGAVAGAMYDQNTFQLDGGNNSNDMDGSMKD